MHLIRRRYGIDRVQYRLFSKRFQWKVHLRTDYAKRGHSLVFQQLVRFVSLFTFTCGINIFNLIQALIALWTFCLILTVNYKGSLNLFSDYLCHPQNINFYRTSQLSCKEAKNLLVIYSLDLIYDDNVRLFEPNGTSPALQIKSLIGVGFLMLMKIRRSTISNTQKQI